MKINNHEAIHPSRGAPRRRTRRGFTLVEILAVVVILGIASAIIIPNMGSRDDMRAGAAARTLVADLTYAQNLAISSGNVVYVKFDLANNKYTLLTAANPDTAVQHPISQSDYVQQFGTNSRGWESITIGSADFDGLDSNYQNQVTLAFDEIGSPYVFSYTLNAKNEMNAGSIVLRCGNFTKTVTVSAATGTLVVTDP